MKRLPELFMLLALCLTLLILWRSKQLPATETAEQIPVVPQDTLDAPSEAQEDAVFDVSTTLRLLDGDEVREIPLREYLTGVLLAEMPISFETQALQAQAVASRTFTLSQMAAGKHDEADVCSDSACCQAWLDEQTLRQRFGAEYESALSKVLAAVDATEAQVLCTDDGLITATYFACSGGRTEDAVAVWGSEVPYLQAVDSPGEEIASSYESTVVYTPQELAEILEDEPGIQLAEDPELWLGACTRTDGDGVAQLEIGGCLFSGVELRRMSLGTATGWG